MKRASSASGAADAADATAGAAVEDAASLSTSAASASTPSAIATRLVHADDGLPHPRNAVIAPISVTTTYRQTADAGDAHFVYSRVEQPVRERVERILGGLEGGHALLYATGLAAAYAAIGYARPRRLLIQPGGYHGVQEIVKLYQRRTNLVVVPLETPPQAGDLIWLESPSNPHCRCQDIAAHAARAHAVGARVAVDATFAPPPIQQSIALGADIVMHSATKYFGGHSDLLAGVLVVRTTEDRDGLVSERNYMGNVCGNLESWLLLRSLRTLELRVRQQCVTAQKLAVWLSSPVNHPYVARVWHLALPSHPEHALAKRQMALYGAMMAIEMTDDRYAQQLPDLLHLFANATSLGGVESLIDWRYRYDTNISKALLRVSIGLEDYADLAADFTQAFRRLDVAPAKM